MLSVYVLNTAHVFYQALLVGLDKVVLKVRQDQLAFQDQLDLLDLLVSLEHLVILVSLDRLDHEVLLVHKGLLDSPVRKAVKEILALQDHRVSSDGWLDVINFM